MSVFGILRIALKSLTRNKTRTFLTMLGNLCIFLSIISPMAHRKFF